MYMKKKNDLGLGRDYKYSSQILQLVNLLYT